LKCATAGYPD